MKRLISVLCVITLLFSAFSVVSFAGGDEFKPYEDSRFFEYGDYSIHYRVLPAEGEFKGRVMMLHGFVCSTYSWRNLAPLLAEAGYEVVLADLPSFGYSTRESASVAFVPRETLIAELMKSIAPIEEWVIAGHSMGGGVAVNIAEEQPVKALLLYCPAPQSEFPEAVQGFVTSRFTEGVMNAFFNYGTRLSPLVRLVIWAATNDLEFAKSYDLPGVTAPVQHDGFGAGMCEMMYRVRPTDLENVGKIVCPVLLCQADKDIVLTPRMKERMNSAFPNAVTYEVKGGRCSAAAAFGSGLLSIRPCAAMIDGKIEVIKKYRGKSKAVRLQYASEQLEKYKNIDFETAFIYHACVPDDELAVVADMLRDAGFKRVIIADEVVRVEHIDVAEPCRGNFGVPVGRREL